MKGFTKITPYEISDNMFTMINKDWLLTASGTPCDHNMLTCSWGGMGVIWQRPVCTVVVRPQRHTYQFLEKNNYFTVSVFSEKYRSALNFCGTKSGRDFDKAKESGLTPAAVGESVAFEQARLVLLCKKTYVSDLKKENFLDAKIPGDDYPEGDFHRVYVGEIVEVYKNDDNR